MDYRKKCKAQVKLGWLHTDYDKIQCNRKLDEKMWDGCDYIIQVSEDCKKNFDKMYPDLAYKSIVIENILSKELIIKRASEFDVTDEMGKSGIKILSIGRFCEAKNFDNIPNIAKRMRELGIDFQWSIIGFGGDEEKILNAIKKNGVEKEVKILGKKNNPYPYIKACDVYIQPSRYEGKAVAVREAQMLGKMVIITNYSTAMSQVKDGYDGKIVSLDNESCAKEIVNIINDKNLMEEIQKNCLNEDYSNRVEIQKIYNLMED